MAFKLQLGHNSGRSGRVYAIIFDLDTSKLKDHYHASHTNAYGDICKYLTSRGFTWVEGSGYFGDETVNAVRCVRIVQRMSKKFQWFLPSVRDIRMLRIEENNDLRLALDDDDDD